MMNAADRVHTDKAAYEITARALSAIDSKNQQWQKLRAMCGEDFVHALVAYMEQIRDSHIEFCWRSDFPPCFAQNIDIEIGNTGGFVRIVKSDRLADGTISAYSRSVHSFVSMASAPEKKNFGARAAGDIFKAASWKAPARHVRGSIFQDAGSGALMHAGAVRYM